MIKNIFFLFLGMLGTVLFCAVFLFIFANSVEMTCNRQSGGTYTCSIEKKLFGKLRISQQKVSGVSGASINESCGGDDGCSFRAELSTADGGSTPFNEVYSDRDIAVKEANQINAYVKGGQSSFQMTEPLQWWVVLLIGGLGLMGLVFESVAVFGQAYRWFVNRR